MEEIQKRQGQIEDAEDILDLEQAIYEEQHIPGFTLEEAKKALKFVSVSYTHLTLPTNREV